MKLAHRHTVQAWLFLAPALLLLAAFSFWPVGYGSVLAFTDYSLIRETRFVGLDNFRYIFNNEMFVTGLQNSLVFLLMVPFVQVGAIVLAVLVNNRLPGIRLRCASGHGRRGAAQRRRSQRGRSRCGRGGRRHEHARRAHQALGARAGRQRGGIGRWRASYRAWQRRGGRHGHEYRNGGPGWRTDGSGSRRRRRQPHGAQAHDGAIAIAQQQIQMHVARLDRLPRSHAHIVASTALQRADRQSLQGRIHANAATAVHIGRGQAHGHAVDFLGRQGRQFDLGQQGLAHVRQHGHLAQFGRHDGRQGQAGGGARDQGPTENNAAVHGLIALITG